MTRFLTMGESARVAALPMAAGIHLYLVSGTSKVAMHLATPTARAVATELHRELPPGEPVTRRPAANTDRSPRPDWPRILARLRAGKPNHSDAEHVAGLLSYLGVKTL